MLNSGESTVWVFHATGAECAAGVWPDLASAEKCLAKHRLSGSLRAYPVGECCFDWAVRKRCTGLKVAVIEEKTRDPAFIGGYTSSAQEEFQYFEGRRLP